MRLPVSRLFAVVALVSLACSTTGPSALSLAIPLAVRVTDDMSHPVAGIAVSWAAVSGGTGVSVGSATTVTDGSGIATVNATLGANGGTNTYTATVVGSTGSPIAFSALAAGAYSVFSNSNGQAGLVNTQLPNPLRITVTGGPGATPIPNYPVTWSVGSGRGRRLRTVLR